MSDEFKAKLLKIRKIFFREKFRFDHGSAYLVFINFALLVTSLVTQMGGSRENIKYYVIFGLAGIWVLGYFLDKIVAVQEYTEKSALKRSYIWQENFHYHDKNSRKISELLKRIKALELKIGQN